MQHATSNASAEAERLADQVQPLEQYRKRREHLFPTRESLQWYLRSRKPRMVAAGAMFLHRGQWHVHVARFDAAIVDIGVAETQGRVGEVIQSQDALRVLRPASGEGSSLAGQGGDASWPDETPA